MKKNLKTFQVGDYVRKKTGEITKAVVIERFDNTLLWGDNPSYPNECLNTVDEIKSIGSQRRDLIEKGDLVKKEGKIFEINNESEVGKASVVLTKELFKKYGYTIEELIS